MMSHLDSEMLVLVLFWSVVVVALLVSMAARERREPEEFDLGERRQAGEVRTDAAGIVPFHHPQVRPAGHSARTSGHGQGKTTTAVRAGHPRPL